MLHSVAVLYHPRRKQAVTEAEWLGIELQKRGVDARVGNGWDDDTISHICCDRDLVVGLGGDGTIIRITRMASRLGVPVMGINLGRVGFLAELTPDGLHDHVDDIAEGRFWIEKRAMLDVHGMVDGQHLTFLCLNEVAVARGLVPRAVHVQTLLDGEVFTTYTADGVLVATATGSTAYSLAAGGPILYPESRDYIITPVAPHLHIGRSMIIPSDTVVTLKLSSERPAVLSVDGTEEHALRPQDHVDVCRSEHIARFARVGSRRYFYTAIDERLK